MLQSICLDDYGLTNPPAVVYAFEQDALSSDKSRAAELEFDFERWAETVTSGVAKLLADAESRDPSGLESAIQAFEQREEELRPSRAELLTVRKRARKFETDTMRLPVAMRGALLADAARIDHTAEKLLKPIESVLRSYRDGRWQLMALRAQMEPPSGNPAFEDADSLLAFLQG